MRRVASRELRNRTRVLLDLVAAGESIVITVDGRPTARLEPLATRPRWMSRHELVSRVLDRQADPALRGELLELADEYTDELPLR